MQSTYKISYELASAGVCVVSGMALGVDAVAACAAIEAGGTTVAVLGCGIDIVYPRQHTRLRREICKHGCVISEFPPAESPYGSNFPKRNRIISGLCQGVLVIEGNKQSGAMITAQKAILQGREVFALPGKINESNSEGPNDLIQKGVNVALSADDIIYHFDFLYHGAIDYRGLNLGKPRSDFSLDALARRGVSTDVYFGRSEIYPPKAPVKEKEPEDVPRDKAEKKWDDPFRAEDKVNSADKGESAVADNSAPILDSLDALTRKVFEAMPLDRAVSPDEFLSADISIAEAVTSLTVLEIMGLVSSLPGGMYTRK
jgi:DNA processing protein